MYIPFTSSFLCNVMPGRHSTKQGTRCYWVRPSRSIIHALVNAFYAGTAKRQGNIFTETGIGNRPDIAKQYEYNPEKARQLLKEADYANKYAETTDLAIFNDTITLSIVSTLGNNGSVNSRAETMAQ
jgi:ABC-type transport system substrate-binding protein